MKTKPSTIPLADLHLNDGTHGLPKNPRFIRDDRFEKLCDSIRDFPEAMPARGIVVDERGVILVGNMRYRACLKLGMKEIPASWVHRLSGLTVEQKRRFIIMDNRSFGDDDMASLADDWDLQELLRAGFDEEQLIGMGEDEEQATDADAQVDQAEELNKKWKVSVGDIWAIGNHKLLCGDSTKAGDVKRLMAGETADIMVTDPPYGVDYDPGWRKTAGINNSDNMGKITNDNRIDWTEAYRLFSGDVAYVWHAGKTCGDIAAHLQNAGFEIRSQIIWAKRRFAISRGHYHWAHEPCWYAFRKGQTADFAGNHKQTTLWRDVGPEAAKRPGSLYACLLDNDTVYAFPPSATTVWEIKNDKPCEGGHSTQKPLECMARPIRNHGARGDIVYDPFAGTGTTMVASENLHRICRTVEVMPPYCAVILERMKTAFPGLDIHKEQK